MCGNLKIILGMTLGYAKLGILCIQNKMTSIKSEVKDLDNNGAGENVKSLVSDREISRILGMS